jgi:hypothetical protein
MSVPKRGARRHSSNEVSQDGQHGSAHHRMMHDAEKEHLQTQIVKRIDDHVP